MNHFVYLYTQGLPVPSALPASPRFDRVFSFVSDAEEAPALLPFPSSAVFLDAAGAFIPEALATPEPREIPPSQAQLGKECFELTRAEDLMKAHMFQGLALLRDPLLALTRFHVDVFPRLQRIVVGNGVGPNCASFRVKGLPKLRRIFVGEDSFSGCLRCDAKNAIAMQEAIRKTPKTFEVIDCPALETICIGNGSFADFTQCSLRGLPRLHELAIGTARKQDGYENRSFAFCVSQSLELRQLDSLESLEIGNYAFYFAEKLVLEGGRDGEA